MYSLAAAAAVSPCCPSEIESTAKLDRRKVMALCEVHWQSNVLRKKLGMYVVLPDVGSPPFATFYLLHGLSDDYTTWMRRTRIEWYVRDLPLIVVMPDGFRGFYTDNDQGPAFARYVGEELPAFVERNFPA